MLLLMGELPMLCGFSLQIFASWAGSYFFTCVRLLLTRLSRTKGSIWCERAKEVAGLQSEDDDMARPETQKKPCNPTRSVENNRVLVTNSVRVVRVRRPLSADCLDEKDDDVVMVRLWTISEKVDTVLVATIMTCDETMTFFNAFSA